MGWKGTVRSLQAASRSIAREQDRARRQQVKLLQEEAKADAAAQAALEVALHQEDLDRLATVHKRCGMSTNWVAISSGPPPIRPTRSDQLEVVQRTRETQQAPGFFDRLLGQAEKKLQASELAISQARQADDDRHKKSLAEYQQQLELQRIAKGVVQGEVEAFSDALQFFNPFEGIAELGYEVGLNFDNTQLEATLVLRSPEQMPKETKSLLKTGRISVKRLSAKAANEIYRSYVCSCVLRVAREAFAILPFTRLLIHATTKLLNPQTGHIDIAPVLSVFIPVATFESLNLNLIDPNDGMKNFVHNIDFSNTVGFAAVPKLQFDRFVEADS